MFLIIILHYLGSTSNFFTKDPNAHDRIIFLSVPLPLQGWCSIYVVLETYTPSLLLWHGYSLATSMFVIFFFFVVLRIEIRVLYMLGRDHWATFLALPNMFLASLLFNLLTTKKRERNLSFNCPSYIIYSHMPYNISVINKPHMTVVL
jgi:hypothetical protein